MAAAKRQLSEVEAHYVIDNVGEMPNVIEQINRVLVQGVKP
jgi:hypothetical protein